MPSPTSPRPPRRRAAPARPPVRQAVRAAGPDKTDDVRTDARLARTREYMRDENKREAALAAKGYWF